MTDLTPEQQQELHELSKALQSEFADNESKNEAQSAKQDLVDLKQDMLKAIKRTLEHGTVEQASKVAMWGYGKLLDEGKVGSDPIRALIEGMPQPAATEVESTEEPSAETIEKAVDIPLDVLESTEPTDPT